MEGIKDENGTNLADKEGVLSVPIYSRRQTTSLAENQSPFTGHKS
jgi:hypothetical protein